VPAHAAVAPIDRDRVGDAHPRLLPRLRGDRDSVDPKSIRDRGRGHPKLSPVVTRPERVTRGSVVRPAATALSTSRSSTTNVTRRSPASSEEWGFGVGVARTTISGLPVPSSVAALLVTAFLVAVGLP